MCHHLNHTMYHQEREHCSCISDLVPFISDPAASHEPRRQSRVKLGFSKPRIHSPIRSFAQDMKNDDGDIGGKGNASEKREFEDTVRPVSPGETGEGLPYAPEHWPNPGDIWGWRVGYRFLKDGSFQDRFLRVPRRLQQRETKSLEFPSKKAVERYLRSEFPEADISAFFASFTWAIRLKPNLIGKYVRWPQIKRTPGRKRKRQRKVRVFITPKDEITNNENGLASTSYLDSPIDCKEEETNTLLEKTRGDLKRQLEEFDDYLQSLDEMHQSSSSMEEESMTDLRKKLSSLLAMGIPNCLHSSENVNELIGLSYKLQNDPNLSKEEASVLDLIQSIPFTQTSFVEAKEISSKADEFLNGLNTKTALVASLKEEYNASKQEMEAVKADEASTLLDILETDQEIAKLEKVRDELAERIKDNSEKLIHWNSIQKKVMETLPKVVDEVQMAKYEKPIWELKKKKAADLEAEILARFAPLEGFSF